VADLAQDPQPTVTLDDIRQAAARIVTRTRRTPSVDTGDGTFGLAHSLSLKLEMLQHTGSFKARGAFNRLLSSELPAVGVIAASGGNHGLAVAFAARSLGVRAEVFVPESSAPLKVARLRELGATVRVTGDFYADAYAASLDRQAQTGALSIHAYDDPAVVAGQGTVGLEILTDDERVDTVLVAVGGGGLIAGVATALRRRARVIGVETEGTPAMREAMSAGHPVDVTVSGVAVDSLGARRLGDLGFAMCVSEQVRSLLVSDEAVLAARRLLWSELRIAAEPGGAVALAALVSGAYVAAPYERVSVIVCGGNTDVSDLR
jgi:threonine dehydratase